MNQPNTTSQVDLANLAETALSGVPLALLLAKYQFETHGFAVVESEKLELSESFMSAVHDVLTLDTTGSYLPTIKHRELVLVEDGKPRIKAGDALHALADTTEMRSLASIFAGKPQIMWHATMNIAEKGDEHPTHRDWRATNPIWVNLIRQSPDDCPPVLHVRGKTTGDWTDVDLRGDKWVVLDAFTDHRVSRLPSVRRSLVLSYAPEEESLRDIRSKNFQWREDVVPPLPNLESLVSCKDAPDVVKVSRH